MARKCPWPCSTAPALALHCLSLHLGADEVHRPCPEPLGCTSGWVLPYICSQAASLLPPQAVANSPGGVLP